MSDVDISPERIENAAGALEDTCGNVTLAPGYYSVFRNIAEMLRALSAALTATQEKLAAAEKYAMACDCDDIRRQLKAAQAQIDAALLRGARIGLEMAAKRHGQEQDYVLREAGPKEPTKKQKWLIRYHGDNANSLRAITDTDIMKEISRE